MTISELTKEEKIALKQSIEKRDDSMRSMLKQLYPVGVPTPLKSEEQNEKEQKDFISKQMELRDEDIKMGIECFRKEVKGDERKKLDAVFKKLVSYAHFELDINRVNLINYEDCEFLDALAERQYQHKHLRDAASMFRCIIQLYPDYPFAWIGWADCELALDHREVAQGVYDMALLLIPDNYVVGVAAGMLFASLQKKDKAREILTKTKTGLEPYKDDCPELYKQTLDLLAKM